MRTFSENGSSRDVAESQEFQVGVWGADSNENLLLKMYSEFDYVKYYSAT